jgi:hypothetical protein
MAFQFHRDSLGIYTQRKLFKIEQSLQQCIGSIMRLDLTDWHQITSNDAGGSWFGVRSLIAQDHIQ